MGLWARGVSGLVGNDMWGHYVLVGYTGSRVWVRHPHTRTRIPDGYDIFLLSIPMEIFLAQTLPI